MIVYWRVVRRDVGTNTQDWGLRCKYTREGIKCDISIGWGIPIINSERELILSMRLLVELVVAAHREGLIYHC
jgi:hypothetical protein